MRKLLISSILTLTSFQAFAKIDGYKDLKFGMTLEETKKKAKCNFKLEEKKSNGVIDYSCNDFKFLKQNKSVLFSFLNNKLEAVLIMDVGMEVFKGLNSKYVASKIPTQKELDDFTSGKTDKIHKYYEDGNIQAFTVRISSEVYTSIAYRSDVIMLHEEMLIQQELSNEL